MRAIQDGRLALGDTAVRHVDLCLGCRACEAVCPSGVEYGTLLESTRAHVEQRYRRPIFQSLLRRVAIERVLPYPGRTKLALLPARLLRWLGADRILPGLAGEALSLLPDKIGGGQTPEFLPSAQGPKRGRVGLISGCVMSVLFSETHRSSLKLLSAAGYEVITPRDQVCCGALYAHGGNLERARACARRNIATFERLDLDAIIINAAGCGSTLKEYGHLLQDDPEWAERGRAFSQKVKDLSEWLARCDPGLSESGRQERGKVCFHDACHLAHAQRITNPPRKLVRAVAGPDFVELPESDVCCGSAGSYNLTEPEMAKRLQDRKIRNILASGVRVVVTTNPGCILQIQAGLRKAGRSDVQVVHIADYLEESRASRKQTKIE
jgi:glycolate oxidase iron-sulfur subunit